MTRRVTVIAAGVGPALLLLFLALDAPLLAWLNLVGIAIYALAYWLLGRRINGPALVLIWIAVLGYAATGTLLIGWDSGFHYYLLMFIPAIVVSAGTRLVPYLLLVLLFACYTGLHALSQHLGALAPLDDRALLVVHGFNVAVVFAMAAYTARFYYATVRRAESRLAEQVQVQALRSNLPTALVIADIDHFKHINDQLGHDAGDQMLVHIGMLLSRTCRTQDIVARWGGEEFLILLPATHGEAALALAERIRQTVATQPLMYANAAVTPALSLGVAELEPGESLDSAIVRADHALYRSKQEGRNRVTLAA
jgi:diguanylate cyclase (GGDEF)-like protein